MTFDYRYFNFCSFILILFFLSTTFARFCSNLTSTDDKDTPCFLESSTHNPGILRTSGSSLVLPCHVARSKRATIEWWYQDVQKTINIKIYPVFPAVRPTVLRFITSLSPISKSLNETDIVDVSILLRHVNVDDSGIYRCVIRPWTSNHATDMEDVHSEDNSHLPSLNYFVDLTGPRLCHTSLGALPCFSNMRTSSPTFVDAYQTAFLQCVVNSFNNPVNVFWVVGNASTNSILITNYLTSNQYKNDRLRRVFPLSPHDYSIELTISRDIHERTYSCVIEGESDAETTLFTYIVRSIDLQEIPDKTTETSKHMTETPKETSTMKVEHIVPHDELTSNEIDELRRKNANEHDKSKHEKLNEQMNEIDDEDFLEFYRREETSTQI